VLGVVLVHTGQYSGFDAQAAFGARGVQLFFVASALTLMFSWNERGDGATAFFTRRVFRIVPMFWLSIPLYHGLNLAAYTPQVFGAAIFLQAIRPDWIVASIVPGGWSVCVETAFYCVFPLIAQSINSFLKACALAVACFAVAWFWSIHGQAIGTMLFPAFTVPEIATWTFLSLPNQLPAFVVGVLCYFVIPEWKHYVSRAATEIILACTLLWIAYLATDHRSYDLAAYSLAFGAAAICLANSAGRYLINGALIHIGRLSFSIYLLHWLCIPYAISLANAMRVSGGARFFVLFCGTVALTTALAAVSYHLIELPMIRLGNRLIAQRRAQLEAFQPAPQCRAERQVSG
jgi:peptidoglycan/LPS O-acetylase OafA/YrhL